MHYTEMLAKAIHEDRLREAEQHRQAAAARNSRKTRKRSTLEGTPRYGRQEQPAT